MKKIASVLLGLVMLASVSFGQANQDSKKTKASTSVKLKKDGTPDKRYKNAPANVRLKKDGTPDKRYKKQ